MTPNIGQGANSGIEDAALLTSLINALFGLKNDQAPSTRSIGQMLQTYQEMRYERIQKIYQRSKFGVRMHTRNDMVKIVAGRYIIPYFQDRLAEMASQVIANGETIDFLPWPERSGSGWMNDDSATKNARPNIGGLGYILTILVAIFGIAVWAREIFLWN